MSERPDDQLPRSARLEIALATFVILALELSVIRWMSQQIRIFAYLNNLLLIASFLGMGLGVAIGKKRPGLFFWTLPSLLVLSSILAFSEELGLMHLRFPDLSVFQWQVYSVDAGAFAVAVVCIMLLFALVTWVFLCAGTRVGDAFSRLEALDAYSADLVGSLLGIAAIAVASALFTPPPVWFAIACAPILWMVRRPLVWISFAGVVVLTAFSIRGAVFSPYNRIDIHRDPDVPGKPLVISVNRDFHQMIHDLSRGPNAESALALVDFAYSLPFTFHGGGGSALVVGAGSGNDAAAAFRQGMTEVVAVDIDPVILEIGRRNHPERPYSNAGAVTVTNDARAYFRNASRTFDVVCFGLLDSHAMFSAMSSLRLDNYVYTVEGVRSAWRLVDNGGVLSIAFSTAAGPWISDRIYSVIARATGQYPVVVSHGLHQGQTFLVGKGFDIREAVLKRGIPLDPRFVDIDSVKTPTDNWPFLYLKPNTFPTGYLTILALVLVLAFASARVAFGKEMFTTGGFDPVMFLLGAAFLLIETRGVTQLSLLFGSTWIVNIAVFSGILLTVLVANIIVKRTQPSRPELFAIPLAISLIVNYLVRADALAGLSVVERALAGGLLNGLPVGFAGIFFSSLFRRSGDSSSALGSNLLGAVFGGCLEYTSMWIGLRDLTMLALAIYAVAFLLAFRRLRPTS